MMYAALEQKKYFRSFDEMINMYQLNGLVNITMQQFVQNLGLNDAYVREMVNGTMRAIYNQPEMNALSGLATLAKLNGEFLHVKGGNGKIIEALINNCKKSKNFNLYLGHDVKSIAKNVNGTFTLTSSKASGEYDLVIVASPLSVANIQFGGSISHLNKFKGVSPKPVPIHVTYIEGDFDDQNFGRTAFPNVMMTEERLTSAKISTIFNFGRLHRLHSMGKIQQNELEALNIFKKDFKILFDFSWSYAAGKFEVLKSAADIPAYVLDTRLFYTSANEPLSSGMECSLFSAKNVANMIEDMYPSKQKKEDM
jgi:protoporphyrinogen oxidase